MKKLVLSLVVFSTFLSCNRLSDEIKLDENTSYQPSPILGARLLAVSEYNSLQMANVEELSLRYKGKNAKLLSATPSSYTIITAPVGNQGGEGSCVAWATTYAAASALEYNYRNVSFPQAIRSPEYVYNQVKVGSCSGGAYVSTALNLMKNQGVCSWAEMPYTDLGCSTLPTSSQKLAASSHKISSWARVDKSNIENVKMLLSMNLPIIIVVGVDPSFMSLNSSNGWIWKNHQGSLMGYHAICVIGYDDSKQAFRVQNSWGSSWGNNGYFWIDYAFFAQKTNGAINECYVAYN